MDAASCPESRCSFAGASVPSIQCIPCDQDPSARLNGAERITLGCIHCIGEGNTREFAHHDECRSIVYEQDDMP